MILTSNASTTGAMTLSQINRALDDSMWLGRAHSKGHARQLVNMLGYALMVNGLALLQHRERERASGKRRKPLLSPLSMREWLKRAQTRSRGRRRPGK